MQYIPIKFMQKENMDERICACDTLMKRSKFHLTLDSFA